MTRRKVFDWMRRCIQSFFFIDKYLLIMNQYYTEIAALYKWVVDTNSEKIFYFEKQYEHYYEMSRFILFAPKRYPFTDGEILEAYRKIGHDKKLQFYKTEKEIYNKTYRKLIKAREYNRAHEIKSLEDSCDRVIETLMRR